MNDYVDELEKHDEDYYACAHCGEERSDDDPVVDFKHPTEFDDYLLMHRRCGADAGLELA